MASISRSKNGSTTIYVIGTDGKRSKISLGKVTKKNAETTKLRLEQLVQDRRLGTPHDSALLAWIDSLASNLRRRLTSIGLLEAQQSAITLEELIEKFLAANMVKSATAATYKQCTDSLIRVLGATTPIDTITAADADRWQCEIKSAGRVREIKGPRSLSIATVAKRTNIAKTIFNRAKRWKLISSSPFEGMKSGSQSNPSREHYVSEEDMQKILDACPDVQTRAFVAVARYAGLRCYSEISQLKWSDINWDRKSLTVRSPKTEGKAGHAVRIVPICEKLQPILMDLFEHAEEGAVDMVPLAKQPAERIYQRFGRIVERAGFKRWPRLLQNLRSSCATDWASKYPVHESSKWMGQSVNIASKHYLQQRDLHFQSVTGIGPWVTSAVQQDGAESGAVRVQNRVQHGAAPDCMEMKSSVLNPETQRGCASSCEPAQPRAKSISGRSRIRTYEGKANRFTVCPR